MRTSPTKAHAGVGWAALFVVTFLAAYFYVLVEWLFVITKPSYLQYLRLAEQIEIFLFSGALLALGAFGLLAPLWLLQQRRLRPPAANVVLWLACLVPGFLSAVLLLTLVDNFTYTLFHFGVVSTAGWGRGLYALLFVLVWLVFTRAIRRDLPALNQRFARRPGPAWIMAGMALWLGLVLAFSMLTNELGPGGRRLWPAFSLPTPYNIIWITSDGLQAANMSLYGYQRQTTPFLDELAQTSLVAENTYTNGRNTAGSITAMFTGQYPVQTRVGNAPDVLRGQDAYQHLPGMLNEAGYFTAQFSVPYYADAYSLNFLNGFDLVNRQSIPVDGVLSNSMSFLPVDFSYFMLTTTTRLTDRLLHMFYIKPMINPYDVVMVNSIREGNTQLDDYLDLLDQVSPPFFVHVHYINTHGPRYYVPRQVFSQGRDPMQQGEWEDDFFDDSILDFDNRVRLMVEDLKRRGLYEQSIIIVGSDHAQIWRPNKRIPLLIHFPHGEHAGRIRENVQTLDIAPTLLEFMGVPVPDWMVGQSLLQPLPAARPIFVVGAPREGVDFTPEAVIALQRKPPFYQFSRINVIYCQRWYSYVFSTAEMETGLVDPVSYTCPEADVANPAQALAWIRTHFQNAGFDVSSLPSR